ncbi:hypothetical protein ONV78_23195 [Hahella sp. CR1]|uniref:hypothetical protein n=1 Tax=Hahella sp. CR1 TaxID=2992807 RepID=UPI0024432536|nr:hypothetical protein [Hahella sp. CR1]MDG9670664.1 hypothetical protein [Hahella sp. CR1]
MKDVHKSALWALICIPITLLAGYFGYALAHGSLVFLAYLQAPGWLLLSLLGGDFYSVWLLMLAQYFAYFVIIHMFRMLLKKLLSRSHKKVSASL